MTDDLRRKRVRRVPRHRVRPVAGHASVRARDADDAARRKLGVLRLSPVAACVPARGLLPGQLGFGDCNLDKALSATQSDGRHRFQSRWARLLEVHAADRQHGRVAGLRSQCGEPSDRRTRLVPSRSASRSTPSPASPTWSTSIAATSRPSRTYCASRSVSRPSFRIWLPDRSCAPANFSSICSPACHADAARRRSAKATLLIGARLFQEVGAGRPHRPCDRSVLRACRRRNDGRRLGAAVPLPVCAADLFRLLRLHRHRARPGACGSASAGRTTSTGPISPASMRDFWRRWHMTLSRFLRDYLYIPLGGSRHGRRARAAI